MIIDNNTLNLIERIIDDSYLSFTYRLVGDSVLSDEDRQKVAGMGLIIGQLPLMETLYLMARDRAIQTKDDKLLNDVIADINIRSFSPIVYDTHQYSVEHAKQLAYEAINSTKDTFTKKVKQEVLKLNNQAKIEEVLKESPTTIDKPSKHKDFISSLMLGVGAALVLSQTNFVRDITTTITETINNAVVDETSFRAANLYDAEVYKVVVDDKHLCQYCRKFYVNPKTGEPRIFKLSELQKNGSNMGLPKSEWKPVVGSTHSRCRCQLFHLAPKESKIKD